MYSPWKENTIQANCADNEHQLTFMLQKDQNQGRACKVYSRRKEVGGKPQTITAMLSKTLPRAAQLSFCDKIFTSMFLFCVGEHILLQPAPAS